MDHKKSFFLFFIIMAVCLGGCTSPNDTQLIPTSTITVPVSPTLTSTFTSIPLPTATQTETFPISTPAFIGTDIPDESDTIGLQNMLRLTYVAQWGRGTILGAAFSPDGSKFVIGSAFGFATYNMQELDKVPEWIPFDAPSSYQGLSFSEDGNYLRLENQEGINDARSFLDGKKVENIPNITWTGVTTFSDGWGDIEVDSPDGTKQLRSHVIWNEENMEIEFSVREVYDLGSGKLLYELPDETFYVRYNDIHQPEGCDISSTGLCGNAYMPSAFHPYNAAFSPTGKTLTILYRAPNYGDTNQFSVLRVYDAQTGNLLDMVGNYQKPIQTFAYEPDGARLIIAYVDGSIQLWDIQRDEPTFGAWHFNDYLEYAEFTSDERFLLLRRFDTLEVRSTQDGSLRSRYEAVTYALSPVDSNIIAIADHDNIIKILKMDSGETILNFTAHEYRIFAVAFSPDGRYIATSGQDCKIKLWDAETGEFIHYFEDTRVNAYFGGPPVESTDDFSVNSRVFIKNIEFIEGTDQIIGFGSWGTVVSWNVHSGATNFVIYSAPLEFYGGMMTVSPHYPDSFSVDILNNQIYIGNMVYDLQTGETIEEYFLPESAPEGCASWGPITQDENLLFTRGYDQFDGKVCILDAHDYHLIHLIDVISNPNYYLTIAGLSLSQDGKTLIIATTMGTVNVYRITQ